VTDLDREQLKRDCADALEAAEGTGEAGGVPEVHHHLHPEVHRGKD
jgi:hypothetical protein